MRTTRGLTLPSLRIAVWARPLARPIEAAFAVDTGCDYPLIMAKPLREALLQAGVRWRPGRIEWGIPVRCERFELQASVRGVWQHASAYFPLSPQVDENLAGLPLLKSQAVCIRGYESTTRLASAA